jgi:hypothetical protein
MVNSGIRNDEALLADQALEKVHQLAPLSSTVGELVPERAWAGPAGIPLRSTCNTCERTQSRLLKSQLTTTDQKVCGYRVTACSFRSLTGNPANDQ